MERLAIAVGVVGTAGLAFWASSQANAAGLYAPTDLSQAAGLTSDDAGDASTAAGSDYFSRLSLAEDPNQGLLTKNPGSSASGLYQFTQATWTALGGDWGTDPDAAFGGLTPSADEQTAMAAKLTSSNAGLLANAGVDVNNITLYAMHIFGSPAKVSTLVNSDGSTPLTTVLSPSTVAKNPALGSTIGSALAYITGKVG